MCSSDLGLAAIEEIIETAFESNQKVSSDTEIESEIEQDNEETSNIEEEIVVEVNEELIPQASLEIEEEASEEIEEEIQQSIEAEHVKKELHEEETSFKPAFELSFDSKVEEDEVEEVSKSTSTQITFDDLLGSDYVDPVFVKPEDLAIENETNAPSNVIPIGRSYNDSAPVISMNNDFNSISINDRVSKGIIIGLNDRIAFMNHLFANSSEDYNRVLSQLMTFDTFQEAED